MTVTIRTGRTSAKTPNVSQSSAGKLRLSNKVGNTVKVGDLIEAKADGYWWPAVVRTIWGSGKIGGVRAIVKVGAEEFVACLNVAEFGTSWRKSDLKVYTAPLTGQGVRNLNMVAPPRFRNGRHFRRPENYFAICTHPEESRHFETRVRTFQDDCGRDYDRNVKIDVCDECEFEIG